MTREMERFRRRLLIAGYMVMLLVLAAGAWEFWQVTSQQMWEYSVGNIMEITQQSASTLRVQLQNSEDTIQGVAEKIAKADDNGSAMSIAGSYAMADDSVYLFLPDGSAYPEKGASDRDAYSAIQQQGEDSGIVSPHMHNGVSVIDQYVRVQREYGTMYMVREMPVDDVVNSMTMNFFDSTGFAYVVDTEGEILLRPDNPRSDADLKNIFDPDLYAGESQELKNIESAMATGKTGCSVLEFDGQEMFFAYRPIGGGSEWYLLTLIPVSSIDEEARNIMQATLLLIGMAALLFIILMTYTVYRLRHATNRINRLGDYMRQIVQVIQGGIWIVTQARPYTLIKTNHAVLGMLQYEGGTGTGYENGYEALKGEPLAKFIYHEDLPKMMKLLEDVLASGKSQKFECRLSRSDGSIIWIGGIVDVSKNMDGTPVFLMTSHDITESKLKATEQEKVHKREKQLLVTALADTYPVLASADVDSDRLQFIYMNGLFPESLGKERSYKKVNEILRGLIHPDYLEEFDEVFRPDRLSEKLRQSGADIWCHVQMRARDGEYHWVAMQVVPIADAHSTKGILMARPFDEQKDKEEAQRDILQNALDAARSANEAKSQFLSSMSHDIRTPLNAILGLATIISSRLDDKEYAIEGLKKIGTSGRHLLGLINDILDMSKIESGKLSIRQEKINFADMMSEIMELIHSQKEAAKLGIHVDLGRLQQNNVLGDALRIRQVYLNIIGNAVKYTKPGGDIFISVRDEPSHIDGIRRYIFTCRDTGIGMDGDFLAHIFEPFAREKTIAASRKIRGTGLGMAITKNLVDLMNGIIEVESKLGEGSTFTVSLPLNVEKADSEPAKADKAQEEAAQRDLKGSRILLVDDNEMNLEIARIFIEETGAEVDVAMNGQEAVDKMAASAEDYYSLILMDVQMPVKDGYQAAREIRQLDRKDVKSINIIALTANAFEEDIQKAMQAGMNGHFAKPIEPDKLKKVLAEYCRQ